MNHLPRVFGEKLDVRWKDKYTGATYTGEELNKGFLKPTIALGAEEVKKLGEWFERFEKVSTP
ncbi:MAG TPA: hypothetical protein ENI23_01610 [bacterium]|nr:hypothetical protein [bacterium]